MNTRETSLDLFHKAEGIRRELGHDFGMKDWNLVVRRAQEVVELALKAALRFSGIDFPKVHDVGKLFTDSAIQSRLSLTSPQGETLAQISSFLTSHRSAAFYVEEDYTEAQAMDARQKADSVLEAIRPRFTP